MCKFKYLFPIRISADSVRLSESFLPWVNFLRKASASTLKFYRTKTHRRRLAEQGDIWQTGIFKIDQGSLFSYLEDAPASTQNSCLTLYIRIHQ
jgi:hypothetical protein